LGRNMFQIGWIALFAIRGQHLVTDHTIAICYLCRERVSTQAKRLNLSPMVALEELRADVCGRIWRVLHMYLWGRPMYGASHCGLSMLPSYMVTHTWSKTLV